MTTTTRRLPLRRSSAWRRSCAGGCNQQNAASAETHAKPKPIAAQTVAVVERELPNTLLLAGTLKANQESDLAANAIGPRDAHDGRARQLRRATAQPIAQLDVRIGDAVGERGRGQRRDGAHAEERRPRPSARATRACSSSGAITQAGVRPPDDELQDGDRARRRRPRRASSWPSRRSATAPCARRSPASSPSATSRSASTCTPSTQGGARRRHRPAAPRADHPRAEHGRGARRGRTCRSRWRPSPSAPSPASVHYIGPAVRATTRDLVFEAVVPNKDKLLRPGLFATAQLDVGTQKLPVVPQDGAAARTATPCASSPSSTSTSRSASCRPGRAAATWSPS